MKRPRTKIVPTKTTTVQIGPKYMYYYQSGQIGTCTKGSW